jgi:hypothetical protein
MRISYGLKKLRDKLSKQGCACSTGALGKYMSVQSVEACASEVTVHIGALAAAKGAGAPGLASAARIADIAKGGMKAMFVAKVKTISLAAACVLLVLTILGAVGLVVAQETRERESAAAKAPSGEDQKSQGEIAPQPTAEKSPEEIAKEAFPGDGVLLVVQPVEFSAVGFGPIQGCEISLQVEKVIRLEAGKNVKTARGKPLSVEQTLTLLNARKDGRTVLFRRRHFRDDHYLASMVAKDQRFRDYLKKGSQYLLVLPSVMQLVPIPDLPIGDGKKMPWCYLDEDEGLFILNYGPEAVRKLPERMKAIEGVIAELHGQDRARRTAAIGKLIEDRDLAEPMLIRPLSSTDAAVRRGAALALAEMKDHRAAAVLAQDLNEKDPVICHDAIVAIGKIPGWDLDIAQRLAAKLDDTKEHQVAGLQFVLSDDAAKTLDASTGQSFGKDKTKWDAWFKKIREESDRDNAPGGK